MSRDDRGLVAITGANGTIGYACVVRALHQGYRVRCIVRRTEAFGTIKTGPSVQPFLNLLEHAVVPDNTANAAYDAAFAGAKYVVHIAGAWPLPHLHPDEQIYHPFIKSTKNVIEAAEKSGTVKRIVFTQAGAGLVDSEVGDTYGNKMEKLLNEHVEVNQEALAYRPPLKSAHQAYCAAKSQCMTSVNELRMSSSTPFSIVQIIPGTVIGPSEFVTTRSAALDLMDRQTKALLFDDMKPRYAFGFVHVQDCARVHIEALNEDRIKEQDLPPWLIAAASPENGISGEEMWKRAVDFVAANFKDAVEDDTFKLGKTKTPLNMPYHVDSSWTESALLEGQKFRAFEDCILEVGKWYLSLPE